RDPGAVGALANQSSSKERKFNQGNSYMDAEYISRRCQEDIASRARQRSAGRHWLIARLAGA
ncbi:MAG: hypothetical protein KC652_24290, partial [Cyanobacteria bacterium HKST-UBA01]|nr:hypothetical protein [Cyanobacteria bacterium HKST-UBA01]